MSHSSKNDRWMQIYGRVTAPCYECETREIACHDRCKKYAEYREKLKLIKDARFQESVKKNIRTTAWKRAPKVRRGTKDEL